MIDPDPVADARRMLGRRLASLRRAAGFRSQATLASLIDYSRSTIANVETGRQIMPRGFWQRCDELLNTDGALLSAYDQLQAMVWQQRHDAGQAGVWQVVVPGLATTAVGVPEQDADGLAAMQSFRAADSQVGGGYLYPNVMRYLQTEVAVRLFGGIAISDGRQVFAWAAALTEMAGWMAYDAGRDVVASQHFQRALDLARLTTDAQLSAHILGSMSHLAQQHGHADDAVRLAQAGRQALGDGHDHGESLARLLALEARVHAGRGDAERATHRLSEAARALDGPSNHERSPWVSRFDNGSLANDAASCFLSLGRLDAAQRAAETILTVRPAGRTRSRVFGHLLLANSLIVQRRVDEACSVIEGVLASTVSLSSYPAHTRLAEVGKRLAPYAANPTVASCVEHVRHVTETRGPFAQWLASEEFAQ